MESSTNNRRLSGGLIALVLLLGMAAALLAVAVSGASAQSAQPDGPEQVYALTTTDNLLSFDGDNPEQVVRRPITGLVGGESLVGIDFRPANGQLYGIGDQSYIYTIDPNTAVATRGARLSILLEGKSFGIDFNPTVDRLRIVSNTDQNLRANVDTGMVATDVTPNGDRDLTYTAGDPNEGENPRVTAVAYRNSQPAAFGTTNTELYDIDTGLDILATQVDPNNGLLATDGPLGRDVNLLTGFDIVTVGSSPAGDRAFAALRPKGAGPSRFYFVNLNSGQTTNLGRIGKASDVEGLAIPIGQP